MDETGAGSAYTFYGCWLSILARIRIQRERKELSERFAVWPASAPEPAQKA